MNYQRARNQLKLATTKTYKIYIDSSDFKDGLLDARLIPWDARIHDKKQIRDESNRWVYKKNWLGRINYSYIYKIELELRLHLIDTKYYGYLIEQPVKFANITVSNGRLYR